MMRAEGNYMDLLSFKSTETAVMIEFPGNGPASIVRGTAYDLLESYVLSAEDHPDFHGWCDDTGYDPEAPGSALRFAADDMMAIWVYHPEDEHLQTVLGYLTTPE